MTGKRKEVILDGDEEEVGLEEELKIAEKIIQDDQESKEAITLPVPPPDDPHAKYEYIHGKLRRCHLCDTPENHMEHKAEQVWFPTLEDLSFHILEYHRDSEISVRQAKMILGVSERWDRKGQSKTAKVAVKKPKQSLLGSILPTKKKDEDEEDDDEGEEEQKGWIRRHPLLSIILVVVVGWLLLVLYRLSQGYTF